MCEACSLPKNGRRKKERKSLQFKIMPTLSSSMLQKTFLPAQFPPLHTSEKCRGLKTVCRGLNASLGITLNVMERRKQKCIGIWMGYITWTSKTLRVEWDLRKQRYKHIRLYRCWWSKQSMPYFTRDIDDLFWMVGFCGTIHWGGRSRMWLHYWDGSRG